ncbi:UrcA family protein [Sphingomonas sp. 28-63-12]|uniref:UrcA family protein n=1 Tax=Sphingomonas sp. 28-63-12 TaxID=1970434 RepID=UPI0035A8CE4B
MKILAIIAAMLAFVAAPGLAQAHGQTSMTLHYGDIDLNSRKGQAVLDRRIAQIAYQLCDTANQRFGANVRAEQRACRDNIDVGVRTRIDNRQSPHLITR